MWKKGSVTYGYFSPYMKQQKEQQNSADNYILRTLHDTENPLVIRHGQTNQTFTKERRNLDKTTF